MIKKLFPIALLIAALGLGGFLMMTKGGDAVTIAEQKKTSLLATDTVNASFMGVGGRVTEVNVTEQQDVKTGDVLMSLDTTDINLQIAQLQTSIKQQSIKIKQALAQKVRPEDLEKQLLAEEAAKEALSMAQLNYDRNKALFDAGAVSQATMDTANNQLQTAQNNMSQLQVATRKLQAQNTTESQNQSYNTNLLETQKETLELQLQALELQKQRMVLRAPSDGKITRIVPKVGESITANTAAVVIQSNQLYYDIYVDEELAPMFQAGNKLECAAVALGSNIEGTIRSVSVAPQYATLRMSREKGQSDASTYLIRVDVDSSKELLPGMTVEVNVNDANSR